MDPQPQQATPSPPPPLISFDDLGGKRVAPAATSPRSQVPAQAPIAKPIDFGDMGGKRVAPAVGPSAPSPAIPSAAPEPEDKGLAHQVIGAVKGPFAELGNTWEGIKSLFADPQEDHEKEVYSKWSAPPPGGENNDLVKKDAALQGKIALALYRVGHGFADQYKKGQAAEASEDTLPGKVLAAGENAPLIGDLVKMMENKEYGQAFTQGLTRAALMKAGGKSGDASAIAEPIEGAPLTAGEAAGPGLRQGAEKLFSKTSTAEKRMGEVMGDRTAAMQNAAENVASNTPTPEATGQSIQDAARDVLDRQKQAQGLVSDMADRAKADSATARTAATERAGIAVQQGAESDIANAKGATEQAGSKASTEAIQRLNERRLADIEAGKTTAKNLSGVDELPVPETDREIISSLRGANDTAKIEESAAHNQLAENAKIKGITVDTTPMQSVAKEVVALEGPAKDLVMSSLPASVFHVLEKVAKPTTYEADLIASRAKDFGWDAQNLSEEQLAAVKKDMVEHPSVASDPEHVGPVPYQTMKTARTAVGEALQAARKHFQQSGMGSNAVRTLQQLYGSMTDSLKASVADHPELSAQFEKANALTRERTSTFVDPKAIRKIVYADDPGKVMGSVMRSGSESDVTALRKALDADKTGGGLARAQRGAMDYILRKSGKAATSDLPAGVNPEAIDYDLALRNARSSTSLRTLLGDEKYGKFIDDLDAKRLAQRAPNEINLDNQLAKIAKAETPEKAAKIAGATVEPSEQAIRLSKASTPEQAAKIAGYDAGADTGVQAAERRATAATAARDRLQSPTLAESGPQKVAEHVASDLEPSKIVERAAGSPEYTDKLLSVLDKHPDAAILRQTLGQRIFRNASDGAMVRGAFGSTDGIFDVEKFQKAYNEARPSLSKILPADNLAAMDQFNTALNKYALSRGIGGGAGMSGRFMAIRQIFGVLSMARGVLSGSPSSFALGAAASFGPRLWMEMATRPALARAVTSVLSRGISTARKAGAVGEAAAQSVPPSSLFDGKEDKVLTLKDTQGNQSRWQLGNGKPVQVQEKGAAK